MGPFSSNLSVKSSCFTLNNLNVDVEVALRRCSSKLSDQIASWLDREQETWIGKTLKWTSNWKTSAKRKTP